MDMDTIDTYQENKNVCFKLDENESKRLGFIMHEIHHSLASIDREIARIADADLNQPRVRAEIKEKAMEVQKLSGDLRNLLDFWQISNSEDYFVNAVARPQALWRNFSHLNAYFKSLIRRKGLTYTLTPQSSYNNIVPVPDFVGYPIINAIVNILIDNAIKYSPKGGEILCDFDDSMDFLTITMENDGPFLKPEEIDNLFLCGMRGENANLINSNGHGYGMNFLKLIIDAHDGTIKVSSNHDYNLDGIAYGKYKCTITLPRYSELEEEEDE